VTESILGFDDAVLGKQELIPADVLGDFPITRKSGQAAYQLAVVVDDAAMNVTEVVRGDDLVDSTFWQIDLGKALELSIPHYVHVPLVVGRDGRRLAKRHGDTRLSHLRDSGVQAVEVVLWAARSLAIPVETHPGETLGRLHRRIAACLDWATVDPHEVVVPEGWTHL
jgi:glutamyl-tRNA synthetase